MDTLRREAGKVIMTLLDDDTLEEQVQTVFDFGCGGIKTEDLQALTTEVLKIDRGFKRQLLL